MARVTLAMASSSTTRCGFLLSSAMFLGTTLGSAPLSTSRLPPRPLVATFVESGGAAGSSFMEDGAPEFTVICEFGCDIAASPESPADAAALASIFGGEFGEDFGLLPEACESLAITP